MSRLLLLLIVGLGLGQFAVAQTYQHLIQPDKYWEIMECDRTLICNYTGGARYHFDGDTVINGQTYAKMYGQALISPWGTTPYCPPFGVSPNIFLSDIFLREDTVAQRIYRYGPWDAPETLVFDLTMETGDTLFSEGFGEIVLDSITTTTFSDGVVRRVYHFDQAKFIEGIGTVECLNNGGPFFPPSTDIPHCDQLYCIEHDGLVLQGWCSGPLSTDDQSYGTAPAPNSNPNPASDQIRLPTISNGPAQVFIYDQFGRLVLEHDLRDQNSSVDIRALRPGTYSYRTVAPDGSAKTGRFVVTR
jgi:hypothetical protein